LIRPGQSAPDSLNERAISLKSELTSLVLERRLVRGQRQLMLNERAEGFGDEVELPGKLLVGPAQSVESEAKPFVELGGAAAREPRAESISEDCRLGRTRLGCKRFELLREVLGQIELVPHLEGLHRHYPGGVIRLGADAGGRTPVIFDESRSDLGSGALPPKGP
jgi:hypothetical protein